MDVSGIPNMGFGGGGYFGGDAATGQPAMSAAQINQGIWGNYSPQQAQSTLDNIYGPGGFGAQTNAYSSAGAAYGRQTGGFAPSNVGNVAADKWGTMTPQEKLAHNQAVGRDFINTNIGNVPTEKWNSLKDREKFDHNQAVQRDRGIATPYGWDAYSGGGIGSDAVAAPFAVPTKVPRVPTVDWNKTFNNMTAGNSYNPYALGGAPWQPSGRDDLATLMSGAHNKLRAGQGWTIAQQPPAASQGTLTSRINQGIYDIGNAGDYYSRMIGGGFGNSDTLTPQDRVIPYMNPNPGGG